MIRGVHHVGISVADLDEAVTFFSAVMGSDPRSVEDVLYPHLAQITGYPGAHARIAMLPIPGSGVQLELIQYLHPPPDRVDMETSNVGNTHVGLAVDDIEAAYQRLLALAPGRCDFRSAGPVQAHVGSLTGSKFMYIRGPGGITVELCTVVANDEAAS